MNAYQDNWLAHMNVMPDNVSTQTAPTKLDVLSSVIRKGSGSMNSRGSRQHSFTNVQGSNTYPYSSST
jgi:hypothetical protein